jgi:hypothetical protein
MTALGIDPKSFLRIQPVSILRRGLKQVAQASNSGVDPRRRNPILEDVVFCPRFYPQPHINHPFRQISYSYLYMKTKVTANKRVVVAYWKNKPENPFEVFSSLKNFCLTYKEYNYNTLSNYLSKEKIAYDNKDVHIERKVIISKPVEKMEPFRNIAPVVRKVL